MKYINSKCRILHLGKNNPLDQYKLGAKLLDSSSVEKAPESLVNSKQFSFAEGKKTLKPPESRKRNQEETTGEDPTEDCKDD
ncbi:hypothetical protein DUI87_16457 [Hirundo rustica rustica]|uniref:Uncharacterized protein n=1 Tax=Hirundo rustica rustica TaxID=333673 RepID=A0A3M0K6T2_HIRRU|nr:hypothetical protein DUI87_16457 [Hirundo rustica rustica]